VAANAAYFAAKNVPFTVGSNVIVEGINFVVDAITNPYQGLPGNQLVLTATGPGSSQGLAIRPFGVGQTVWANGIQCLVAAASGLSLTLAPAISVV
jgi:hypothetical protein